MGHRERDIKDAVRLALGRERDVVTFDNPSGVARFPSGAVVPYGVGLSHRGGADLIGILRARDGRGIFLAPELKTATGRQAEDQRNFEVVVRRFGGEYALIRSPDEALDWVSTLRRRHG